MEELERLTDESQQMLNRLFTDHLTKTAKEVITRETREAWTRIEHKFDTHTNEVSEAVGHLDTFRSQSLKDFAEFHDRQKLVEEVAGKIESGLDKIRQEILQNRRDMGSRTCHEALIGSVELATVDRPLHRIHAQFVLGQRHHCLAGDPYQDIVR